MTPIQKVIKYCAIAFAAFLIVAIIGGIISAVSGIAYFVSYSSEDIVGDVKDFTFEAEISELKIDMSAAELRIVRGDEFKVESNLEKISVDCKKGRLTVSEKSRFFNFKDNRPTVTITVPAGFEFSRAVISTGAGRVVIEELISDSLDLDFGAGEVVIDSLTANKKAEIDGGAGSIRIDYCNLADLDFDMGVGELKIAGELKDDCEFNLGVGEVDITLIGGSDLYRLDIEKGLGDIRVNGESVKAGRYGTGKTEVEISGGIGAINVKFE